MANEETPLLPDGSKPRALGLLNSSRSIGDLRKKVVSPPTATWEARSDPISFLYLSAQTLKNHYCCLFACVASALVCAHNDMASKSLFDPLVFKSIFIVFGFTIGFRNMRANQRRGDCLMSVRNICHATWELLMLLPYDEHRPRMREQLLCALEAIAEYVMSVADRGNYKYALAGTVPGDKAANTSDIDGPASIHLGPTTLTAATLLALEDEMSRLQKVHLTHPDYGASQKYQRTFWAKKLRFDEEHYNLVNYAIPSVSDAYVVLINSSAFIFGTVLPWGLHCNNVSIQGVNVMGAGTFLVINTIVIMSVLLGLNTLSAQHEDPFMVSFETLDLRQHMKMFRTAVEHYDETRMELQGTEQDIVALSSFLTTQELMTAECIDDPDHEHHHHHHDHPHSARSEHGLEHDSSHERSAV